MGCTVQDKTGQESKRRKEENFIELYLENLIWDWCHFCNKFLQSLRRQSRSKDSSVLKVLGAWLPAFCADQDRETRSHQQAIRNVPNPSGPEGGVYYDWVFFALCLAGIKLQGSPLHPCNFFRVVSSDGLCCWECATGVFWDERCCVSAIRCFCCLNWSTDICTGVINRLNCPNRDSSPLLLQNACCVPVATAYTAKLQLARSVFHQVHQWTV